MAALDLSQDMYLTFCHIRAVPRWQADTHTKGIKDASGIADDVTDKTPFIDALRDRVLLFDGAMGTSIQEFNPGPDDFPDAKDGFNDGLVLTRPEWIKEIHRSYLEAGSDCIETNSFGSNKIKLEEYGFGDRTVSFNNKIARLACEVSRRYDNRYVVGSMGPTGYLPSTDDPDLGQKSLDDISHAFELQAEGLISGGVDALLIETSQDILEVKLAIEGAKKYMSGSGHSVPIIANVTLDQYGKMLLGTPVHAAYTTISGMDVDVFGINCSTGPQEMTPSVKWLGEESAHPVLVVPNAGMPKNEDGQAVYTLQPDAMAEAMNGFLSKYDNIRIIGGCCGTTAEHIRSMRHVLDRGSHATTD